MDSTTIRTRVALAAAVVVTVSVIAYALGLHHPGPIETFFYFVLAVISAWDNYFAQFPDY